MIYTDPKEWFPVDGFILEPAAEIAVKSTNNNIILAGPGAGKTELLAQRACFLLQTNLCPSPQRILAISFKTDAADNLAKRVQLRCDENLAARFESRTFDSFAKQILDRFRLGLPKRYQPTKDYEILLSAREIRDIAISYITENNPAHPNWQVEIDFDKLYKQLLRNDLPISGNDIYSWVLVRLWDVMLQERNGLPSILTFNMISKLVDYLLKKNPLLVKSIQMTYSHVFLDEFQDTTYLQYNLLKNIFLNKSSILTSVGDDKQQIMGWAGAMSNPFEQFEKDFEASPIELIQNHRSAPRLIEIQNVLAKIINEDATDVTVSKKHAEKDGVCQIWRFKNHLEEAEIVAENINNRINNQQISPRDICIIVKQQERVYAKALIEALEKRNIGIRIEADYQNLLAEEFVKLIIDFFKVATSQKANAAWTRIIEILIFINGYEQDYDNEKILSIELKLSSYVTKLRDDLKEVYDKREDYRKNINIVLEGILKFLGEDKYFRSYPKYTRGTNFERIYRETIEKLIISYEKTFDWVEAISDFLGFSSVPIMTIHKSKGLEYDTVIFLGLEDNAFWSFDTQTRADMCAFFVALSRAKTQCFFTFSATRETSRFNQVQVTAQSFRNISSLYKILESANVDTISF